MRKDNMKILSVLALAFFSTFVCFSEQATPNTNDAIVVVDVSNGCFHHHGGKHELLLETDHYHCESLSVSTQEVENIRNMILNSSTKKQELLTFLGITETWFQQNRERLVMEALKSHWKNKYTTFESLPHAAQNVTDYEGITDLVTRELAGGDEIGSTTEVEFSVTFPGSPHLKIYSYAERPGMLPLHVTYGTNTWKTYDPSISAQLQKLALMTGPNYRHLNIMSEYGNEGWNPDKYNTVLEDGLDAILCEEAYKTMPGYEAIKDKIEITKPSSGYLINMEPRSMILTLIVKNKSYIDRVWYWAHITDDGEPKDSWDDIMQLIDAADQKMKDHDWLLKWRNQSPNRHIQLLLSGGEPIIGSKSFENDALKRIKRERTPNFMLYLRKGNSVWGRVFVGSKDDAVTLYNWKKSKTEPWLDSANFPVGSTKYALISPEGNVSIK
jgi:hypothetical protein